MQIRVGEKFVLRNFHMTHIQEVLLKELFKLILSIHQQILIRVLCKLLYITLLCSFSFETQLLLACVRTTIRVNQPVNQNQSNTLSIVGWPH